MFYNCFVGVFIKIYIDIYRNSTKAKSTNELKQLQLNYILILLT